MTTPALLAERIGDVLAQFTLPPLELYAASYESMAKIGSDGRVNCTSVAMDIRQNMMPKVAEAFDLLRESLAEIDAKQAKIDMLMLEFCPNEITSEQRAEWSRRQELSSTKIRIDQ